MTLHRIAQMTLALWGMSRPIMLVSVALVYALGVLIARADGAIVALPTVLAGTLPLLLVAISIHYTNEYADYETDALTTPTPYSGGSGVLERGWIDRRSTLIAAWVTLFLGVISGLLLMLNGTLPPSTLLILLLGAFGGWMYSLPPLKLAWRGWGEVDNALLGGLLLPLYGYTIVTATLSLVVALSLLPFTMLVFLNLLATTWADRHADAQVGKYTLATRMDVASLRRLYMGIMLAAYGIWLLTLWIQPFEVVIIGLLALPMSAWAALRYTRTDAPHASVHTMVVFLLAQLVMWMGII